MTFRASPQRRHQNYAQFLARTRQANPAAAANLASLLRNDPIDAMGTALQAYGFRTNDVADAYAVWWMNAWQAAHGDLGDASRGKAQAVRAQAASALAATPEFGGASDAAKQEFAESLLIQAALIGASADAYKNDPAMMRKLGAAVRQGARGVGLDLDSMTLTEEGFVPARKTGALGTGNDPAVRSASTYDSVLVGVALAGLAAGGFMLFKGQQRRG